MSFNPPHHENVSTKTYDAAIETIEQKLGLTGQPRVILFHEKDGRRPPFRNLSAFAAFDIPENVDADSWLDRRHVQTGSGSKELWRDEKRRGLRV